ncbi:MAG: hypothetical protein ABI658_22565 [Acidimicrobiales bacterium]
MSHPEGLPDLFLDRSLGRIKVAHLLRSHGLRLTTLAEHYGMPRDETVADVEWLELVGTRGWVALMKDDRIRYQPEERAALRRFAVRCFVITNANLTAEAMADRFIHRLDAMTRACKRRKGPFLYSVGERRLTEIRLR